MKVSELEEAVAQSLARYAQACWLQSANTGRRLFFGSIINQLNGIEENLWPHNNPRVAERIIEILADLTDDTVLLAERRGYDEEREELFFMVAD